MIPEQLDSQTVIRKAGWQAKVYPALAAYWVVMIHQQLQQWPVLLAAVAPLVLLIIPTARVGRLRTRLLGPAVVDDEVIKRLSQAEARDFFEAHILAALRSGQGFYDRSLPVGTLLATGLFGWLFMLRAPEPASATALDPTTRSGERLSSAAQRS